MKFQRFILTVSDSKTQSAAEKIGYDRISRGDDGVECICSLTSANGSIVTIRDLYTGTEDYTELCRTFRVEKQAGNDMAFCLDTDMELSSEHTPEELSWFAPGYWYGKGSVFFKLNEKGEAGDPLDCFCAPFVLCYDENTGNGISVTDHSPGRRRTIVEDKYQNLPGTLISDRFFLPGMTVYGSAEGGTGFRYSYPGASYRNGLGTLYRMLPMSEGLERKVNLEIRRETFETYQTAMKTSWRREWRQTSKLHRFRDPETVRRTVLEYVDSSITEENGAVIYMKDTEFHEATSGFLFRNIDLAHLMLEASTELNKPEWARHAVSVIDSQIENHRMYGSGKLKNLRPSVESLSALTNCYLWAKKTGYDGERWLKTVIEEAEELKNIQEYFSVTLFCRLYGITSEPDCLKTASEKGEYYWNNYFSRMLFTNGITDCIPGSIDRESAVLAVEGYLDLYEADGQRKWLDYAVFCADYLETMQVIQDIDMDPFGSTGEERDRRFNHTITMAGTGNNLSAIGLSHIVAGEGCGDIYNIYAVPDYWRLYRYTGDEQYLQFARELLYHTLQYVDMGDRVNGASDLIHHTGKGFINEFYGIGIASSYVTGRGQAHGENIGWCPYVLLQGMHRLKQLTGSLEM